MNQQHQRLNNKSRETREGVEAASAAVDRTGILRDRQVQARKQSGREMDYGSPGNEQWAAARGPARTSSINGTTRRLRDEAMAPGRAHDGTHDGTHGPPVPESAPVPAWKADPRVPVHGGFASPTEGQGDQTVSNQTVISSPPCPAQPILSRRCLAQVHWKPGCCPRRRLNLMRKTRSTRSRWGMRCHGGSL